MKIVTLCSIIFIVSYGHASDISHEQLPLQMVINHPTADLFLDLNDIESPNDTIQTQLLYGERVIALQAKGDWLKVAARELPIKGLVSRKWEAYEGWISKDCAIKSTIEHEHSVIVHAKWATIYERPSFKSPSVFSVPFGTMLHAHCHNKNWWRIALVDGSIGYVSSPNISKLQSVSSIRQIRNRLKELAHIFLECDYSFGGRSPVGLNCSGLTNLLYRACGIQIPLKAHDQYLKAIPCEPVQMQTGDLVFIQWSSSCRMKHVLMYLGNEMLIEASTHNAKKVVICKATERFGRPLHTFRNGDTLCDGKKIFFGSLLTLYPSPDLCHSYLL